MPSFLNRLTDLLPIRTVSARRELEGRVAPLEQQHRELADRVAKLQPQKEDAIAKGVVDQFLANQDINELVRNWKNPPAPPSTWVGRHPLATAGIAAGLGAGGGVLGAHLLDENKSSNPQSPNGIPLSGPQLPY